MIIVWTYQAASNRFDQLRYVELDNAMAAIRLDIKIELQTTLLSDFPRIGRPGRRPGTRELVISGTPYIAVYRIRENVVEILRLLHGAQKWP